MGYCILMINCVVVRPSYTHRVIPRGKSRISCLFRVNFAHEMQSLSWKSQSNISAKLPTPEQLRVCESCRWGMGGSNPLQTWKTRLVSIVLKAAEAVVSISRHIFLMATKFKGLAHPVDVVLTLCLL